MQNTMQKFRKQVFCLRNWQLWWAPTAIEFNIFCWNFAQVSYLPSLQKGVRGKNQQNILNSMVVGK